MYITKLILFFLICLYILKIISIGLLLFYDYSTSKKIVKYDSNIKDEFKKLINIDLIKQAFDENNNFIQKFKEFKPNEYTEIFTHTLITTITQNDPNGLNILQEYLIDQDTTKLEAIIKLYFDNSMNFSVKLLDYTDLAIEELQKSLSEIEQEFYILLNFLKQQNYPINIVIDTFLLVIIILCFIIYILYYKLINILIICLITGIVLFTIYMKNTSFSIIMIILGLYIFFYTLFGYKLYQQIWL